ncbi:hypothetical protein DYBT9275_00697 [Dyadobacter sp. CECT 9275]|uniref:Uncharacterized protein n=1 Tax=Dyadobacter helix TaxID=2822344 RepID=A0A916NJU6_9BACT|nr:hypothetical protein DYBT9275_00697 [Dyadobacter sp. CECT 9275]
MDGKRRNKIPYASAVNPDFVSGPKAYGVKKIEWGAIRPVLGEEKRDCGKSHFQKKHGTQTPI